MKIVDLTPEHEHLYFCCLEDWSDEIKEAGDHKACWYCKMKDNGLRVKLAKNAHHKTWSMKEPKGLFQVMKAIFN
jgi:hypothetical protein